MTFRTWSILARPGDQSFEGMMHTTKCRKLLQRFYTRWLFNFVGWCMDVYFEDKRNRDIDESIGLAIRIKLYGDKASR